MSLLRTDAVQGSFARRGAVRRLHLTPNSGKSKVLSLVDARTHFHFATNKAIDVAEKMPHTTMRERRELRKQIKEIWDDALANEGVGEWQKILKRLYRQAGRARFKLLRSRAATDVKEYPSLTPRVADYLRYVLTVEQYVDFVERVLDDPEQIYPDVSYQLVESLLLLEPEASGRTKIRRFAQGIMRGRAQFAGADDCRVLVPLLLLRFGDRRSVRALAGKLGSKLERLSPQVTRSICVILVGYGGADLRLVQDAASRLLRNHLSIVVKMLLKLQANEDVPGSLKARIQLTFDSITGAPFLGIRAVATARLVGLSGGVKVKQWLREVRKKVLSKPISEFDKRLLKRLWPV